MHGSRGIGKSTLDLHLSYKNMYQAMKRGPFQISVGTRPDKVEFTKNDRCVHDAFMVQKKATKQDI